MKNHQKPEEKEIKKTTQLLVSLFTLFVIIIFLFLLAIQFPHICLQEGLNFITAKWVLALSGSMIQI